MLQANWHLLEKKIFKHSSSFSIILVMRFRFSTLRNQDTNIFKKSLVKHLKNTLGNISLGKISSKHMSKLLEFISIQGVTGGTIPLAN